MNKIFKPQKSDREYYLFALKIAGDFGASIFVPVIIFALIGQYLDEKYQRQPLFTILGLILAFLISAKIIYKKAQKYGQEYQNLDKK